jgi:hypothetical protein
MRNVTSGAGRGYNSYSGLATKVLRAVVAVDRAAAADVAKQRC